jgi:hypothetical protein
VGE